MINDCILVIPDIHYPYSHPDVIPFLTAIKKKYKPTRIINLGDEVDGHAISMHDSDPDLDSAGVELSKSILMIEELGNLFPIMDLMESNHGSLVFRRAKKYGIPKHVIKSYSEMLQASLGWKWHNRLVVTLPNKQKCLFVHSLGANVLQVAQSLGMSVVEGHHHSQFEIRYYDNGESLIFGLVSACLIDDESLAYSYNKLSVKRPIMGASLIINSLPILVPMRLNKNRRWTGEL